LITIEDFSTWHGILEINPSVTFNRRHFNFRIKFLHGKNNFNEVLNPARYRFENKFEHQNNYRIFNLVQIDCKNIKTFYSIINIKAFYIRVLL